MSRPSACSVCSVMGNSLNIGDKSIVEKMQPSAKATRTTSSYHSHLCCGYVLKSSRPWMSSGCQLLFYTITLNINVSGNSMVYGSLFVKTRILRLPMGFVFRQRVVGTRII